MKKVLIITYYWPPSGGSGVQRWLKFVKYLTRLGWQPYVYTPENPSFSIIDNSLLKDVPASVEIIKRPIWEPYGLFDLFSWTMGKKPMKHSDMISAEKKSLFSNVVSWIRGNFFMPDARVFWVKPSVRFLNEFIVKNQIDKIITTGPPHSVHLIGFNLKKKNPSLKWVADFRDLWSEWDLLDTLLLTAYSRKRHQMLENKVLTTADCVLTVTPYYVDRFKRLGAKKTELITNGFDEDDFQKVIHHRTNKFAIRHIGVVDELRDPRPAMKAVKQLMIEDEDFKDNTTIEFIGNVNSAFKEFVFADEMLKSIVVFVDSIPHSELVKVYGNTDLQLLVLAHTAIASGNLPGKFFEYLASGNPTLAIGPEQGDAADVLHQTQAGEIYERADIDGIKKSLQLYFKKWKAGTETSSGDVSMFTRKKLTEKLVALLEELK